ncbi:MAG TPA: hypothetical protein VMU81_23025 [Acetobacteraceae bacterium]|jgi:hypothetical protein|nr:hypothetical protein [Acetobacteraceae bacterium]
MAEELSADDFIPLIGEIFQSEGQRQTLTLASVDQPAHARWPQGLRKPFSLILRGVRDDVLAEGSYRVTAGGRRNFELYIIPIETAARDYQEYQIVFN